MAGSQAIRSRGQRCKPDFARDEFRGCDLVKPRLEDICSGTTVRRRATIVQKKTRQPVQFEISEQSRNSVEAWLPMLRTTSSRSSPPADFMQVLIFQPANMPGWCIAGLNASAWSQHFTTRIDAPHEGCPDLSQDW